MDLSPYDIGLFLMHYIWQLYSQGQLMSIIIPLANQCVLEDLSFPHYDVPPSTVTRQIEVDEKEFIYDC